jgi:L-asparaginase/Glu-tRNA(Gln) amidotransferase subunit D
LTKDTEGVLAIRSLGMATVVAFCAVASHAQPPAAKPRVRVLSTDGTISGRGDTRTNLTDHRSGSLLGEQLVAAVPEIAQIADVKVEQIVNVSSTDISLDNWLTMARRINAILAADAGVAGVVITHGTNTLEEPEPSRPVIVRSARVGNGRVVANETYEPMGMIPADNLNPQKARVLLMLALTRTPDVKAIARMFREY